MASAFEIGVVGFDGLVMLLRSSAFAVSHWSSTINVEPPM